MTTWDFAWAVGDTWPALTKTLEDADGQAVDLTTAALVAFELYASPGATALVDATCVVASPPTLGEVTYQPQDGDLDTPGQVFGRFRVEWDDGTIGHFPNDAYLQGQILP